jgi:hypothetical protein
LALRKHEGNFAVFEDGIATEWDSRVALVMMTSANSKLIEWITSSLRITLALSLNKISLKKDEESFPT